MENSSVDSFVHHWTFIPSVDPISMWSVELTVQHSGRKIDHHAVPRIGESIDRVHKGPDEPASTCKTFIAHPGQNLNGFPVSKQLRLAMTPSYPGTIPLYCRSGSRFQPDCFGEIRKCFIYPRSAVVVCIEVEALNIYLLSCLANDLATRFDQRRSACCTALVYDSPEDTSELE